ncbi:hypothetical protein I6G66_13625 [Delftia acidovorans]|uniref:Uncharacterized protein n=1 Tax=Delftia acidovorans TaxID=80866 RepID=A0A7T2W246_DELAC|nr:hypothetical protein [Delftia acidovorans]QPS10963.1 hypothetical protein I6G66_13625 [Delftia acidovorans]
MAVHSKFLGPVTVSGDEAKALTRRLAHGRGTQAAVSSARNGRKLATTFTRDGTVRIKLKPTGERLKGKD